MEQLLNPQLYISLAPFLIAVAALITALKAHNGATKIERSYNGRLARAQARAAALRQRIAARSLARLRGRRRRGGPPSTPELPPSP